MCILFYIQKVRLFLGHTVYVQETLSLKILSKIVEIYYEHEPREYSKDFKAGNVEIRFRNPPL